MKHLSLLLFTLLLFSCGSDNRSHPGRSSLYSEPREADADYDDQPVYICTGKYAKAYHYQYECEGLDNCKGEIETISIDEAEDIGRHPCRYCSP